jgi:hypothetical protein
LPPSCTAPRAAWPLCACLAALTVGLGACAVEPEGKVSDDWGRIYTHLSALIEAHTAVEEAHRCLRMYTPFRRSLRGLPGCVADSSDWVCLGYDGALHPLPPSSRSYFWVFSQLGEKPPKRSRRAPDRTQ